jgi:hypothetical protein
MHLGRQPVVAAAVAEDRVEDEALDPDKHDPAHDQDDVVEPEDLLGLGGVRLGRDHATGGGEEGQREQGSGAKEDPNPGSGLRS